MIQFVHPLINTKINIYIEKNNIIVIENTNFMVSIVDGIIQFLNKNETEIRFLENDELCKKVDKFFIITDLFNIDFNSKALQSVLIKKIAKSLDGSEFQIDEIYEKAYQILIKCLLDLDIAVDINPNLDKTTFVKMFSPLIQSDFDNMLEKLVLFINVLVELIDLKCFVILNLHEYLSKEDCELFYEHCRSREVAVLTLQTRQKYSFNDEQLIIIDKDLCEIFANYDNL